MIKVKVEYINIPNKTGKDYFVYTNFEVDGHAQKVGYDNNIKVCAGVSACCYGINRLIDPEQFTLEYGIGHFRCYTERTKNLRKTLDHDSVYALNTLLAQLYEIYCKYPNAFESFEIIDVKERYENYEQNERKYTKSRRTKNKLDLNCLIKSPFDQEN